MAVRHPRRTVGGGNPRTNRRCDTQNKNPTALDGEGKAALREQPIQHRTNAELVPQPRKQQRAAESASPASARLLSSWSTPLKQQRLVREFGARGEQGGERARGDQSIGAAKDPQSPIEHRTANALVRDNMQIATPAQFLDPKDVATPPRGALSI